jgi:hypothetical protein
MPIYARSIWSKTLWFCSFPMFVPFLAYVHIGIWMIDHGLETSAPIEGQRVCCSRAHGEKDPCGLCELQGP